MNFKEIVSVTITLFSVIDILGSIPAIIQVRKKVGDVYPLQTTIISGAIMVTFMYVGHSILRLFGVDIKSFAVAGAIIIFLIGLEMILGRNIFKNDDSLESTGRAASVVPLAFPMIAGSGTITTLMSLRSTYHDVSVIIGILINLVLIYLVLRSSEWIERKIGRVGESVLRKLFGVILVAIAIKLFKTNLGL